MASIPSPGAIAGSFSLGDWFRLASVRRRSSRFDGLEAGNSGVFQTLAGSPGAGLPLPVPPGAFPPGGSHRTAALPAFPAVDQAFRPQGASPSAALAASDASAGAAAAPSAPPVSLAVAAAVVAPGANAAEAPGPEVVALGFPDGAPPSAAAAAGAPLQILVQWEAGCDDAARDAALARCGGHRQELIQTSAMKAAGEGVMEVIRLPADGDLQATLAAYGSTAGVRYAEVDRKLQRQAVSNDPNYTNGSLWGMYGSDQSGTVGPAGTTNAFGTQAENAWNRGFLGSRSVYVGIIDEGFDYNHQDLAPNAWVNPFDPSDGIDNDGNGYVDDVRGWDFYNNDNTIFDGPGDDHGTHVAGTIGAAGGNGIGVAGINWNVSLISAKFLGDAGGYLSGAIQSLDYLTDLKIRHGLNIVAANNSWGGGGYSKALQDAITRAARQNILFIAAAGNSTSNNDVNPFYPASYNTTATAGYDSVISVASITSSGALSSFSSYGSTTVDLGAPGSSIVSTLPGNSYGSYSGTSMATPHVTGAVALYAASKPGATAQQIRTALLGSTTPTPSLAGKTVTGGRLNVDALLSWGTQPVLSVSSTQLQKPEGNSGATAFTFTVSRSGDWNGSSSVQWRAAGSGGNPADGADFGGALPGGTVTFAAGVGTQTITVNVSGDTTVEPDEAFTVSLSNPVGATLSSGASSATATIVNDDLPVVTVAVSPATAAEDGPTNLLYTFTRSGPTTNPLTVSYAVGGTAAFGVDYTQSGAASYSATTGTITFASGSAAAVLTIDPTVDTSVEADETVAITLSSGSGYTPGTTTAVVGTILNDDVPPPPTLSITADAASRAEGNSGATAFTFTVSRSGDWNGSSSVQWRAAGSGGNPADGADFGGALPGGTVTFAAGVGTQTITVNVSGDTTVEPDEAFTVSLSNPVGATLSSGASSATATIANDDGPLTFTNNASISIPDQGASNPFPSTVTVEGLSNVTVASVQVSLFGLSHTWPDDLDILLVGPTGVRSLVMSDAGGPYKVSNINLTFSSQASTVVPDNTALTATSYRPADYTRGDIFSAPAPVGPYTADFSVFNGTNPNGTWSLYVQDDSRGDSGSIARGWALALTTSPLPASTSPRVGSVLQGSASADTFVVRFGESTASAPDQITNFEIGRDRIALRSSGNGPVVPTSLRQAPDAIQAPTLSALVSGVFTDADGAQAGNQPLAANGAALVVASSGPVSGTYLIVNDAMAGYQAASDLVVNLTGYAGPLSSPLTPATLFV